MRNCYCPFLSLYLCFYIRYLHQSFFTVSLALSFCACIARLNKVHLNISSEKSLYDWLFGGWMRERWVGRVNEKAEGAMAHFRDERWSRVEKRVNYKDMQRCVIWRAWQDVGMEEWRRRRWESWGKQCIPEWSGVELFLITYHASHFLINCDFILLLLLLLKVNCPLHFNVLSFLHIFPVFLHLVLLLEQSTDLKSKPTNISQIVSNLPSENWSVIYTPERDS